MLTQATKADDDDFQEFQEAPKGGLKDQPFADFQGASGGSFSTTIAPQQQSRYKALFVYLSIYPIKPIKALSRIEM